MRRSFGSERRGRARGWCKGVLLVLAYLVQSPALAQPMVAEARDPEFGIVEDYLGSAPFGVAYSGFREGQHPDRGSGAINPAAEEIAEDLDLLVAHGFGVIRLYDSGVNSEQVLATIRARGLPLKVLLGAWLDAELSNHEHCPWLDEPIADSRLRANARRNEEEIGRLIRLAREYGSEVVAVNVGNEALVSWTDHLVAEQRVREFVRRVRSEVPQPVTVAESHAWWSESGAALAAEIDFVGVHSYPIWEGRTLEEAADHTLATLAAVRRAIPDRPLALLEAGWPTRAREFGAVASEAGQARYLAELRRQAQRARLPVFFFEAFDEPWKGDPTATDDAEKHWGLFDVRRVPKAAVQPAAIPLYRPGAVALAVNLGGDAYNSPFGFEFQADDPGAGGRAGRMQEVRGSQDPRVHRTWREGELSIRRPLPDGRYDLTLLFTEPEDVPVGARVFDVRVQGRPVIEHLDVRHARDGRHGSALSRTATGILVEDGTLQLDLVARQGQPVLSGFVVRRRDPDDGDWRLVWGDEFDREGPPDPARWTPEIWAPGRVNREDQAYTDRPRNLRVEDGRLIIEAHRERHGDAQYTSARMHSRGKGDFLYGRIDIRARLPGGQGTWPALWMMPSDPFRYATNCSTDEEWHGNSDCDAWPNSGEIDIMEHVGYDMFRVHGTVHTRAYYWVNWEQRKGSVEVRDVERAWHVYSLLWEEDELHVFIDGVPYFSYRNEGAGWETWPFDHPFHLIFNLAVGGDWGRAGGPIDDSIFPVRLEVDHVRVFERVEAAGTPRVQGQGSGRAGAVGGS